MVKIIKNGNEKTFFGHCFSCGSEFEYQFEDVQTETDGTFKTRYVECPVCKEKLVAQMLTADETEQCKLSIRYLSPFNSCCAERSV